MLVDMKCPNCGAPMTGDGGKFSCPHCGTVMFDVVEAKIDEDVTVITAEEFAQKLAENKRSFVINVNDRLEEFDIDTMVANKKIKDATEYLAKGEFENVKSALFGVNDKLFSVARLLYLSSMKVHDEYELTKHIGNIAICNYSQLLSLADEETKRTYNDIREYCLKKQAVKNEILEVEKLLDVKLYDEAITYSKRMCQIYPQAALAWCELYKAKKLKNPKYNGKEEYKKALSCPDYLGNIQKVKEDCDNKAKENLKEFSKVPVLIFWFLILAVPLLGLYETLFSLILSKTGFEFLKSTIGSGVPVIYLIIIVAYLLTAVTGSVIHSLLKKKRLKAKAYKTLHDPEEYFKAIYNNCKSF